MPSFPSTVFTDLGTALAPCVAAYGANLYAIGYASGISGAYGLQDDTSGPNSPVAVPVSSTYDFTAGYNLVDLQLHFNFQQPDSWIATPNTPVAGVWHQWTTGDAGRLVNAQSVVVDAMSTPPPPLDVPFTEQYIQGTPTAYYQEQLYDVTMTVTRAPGAPKNPCTGLPPSIENPGYCFDALSGNFIKSLSGRSTHTRAIPRHSK